MQNDSLDDTLDHIGRVREMLKIARDNLAERAKVHDQSKFLEPEKSAFDRLKELSLSGMAYGSPEYKACLEKEKPAIQHHYAHNTHHPEHFENSIQGMSLFDLLEMLIDWKAASERMQGGGSIAKSLEVNQARFAIGTQLQEILKNTAAEMGWSG